MTAAAQNRGLAEQELKQGATILRSRPSHIWLETSAVCNLHCVQCPREYPGREFEDAQLDPSTFPKLARYFPYLTHINLTSVGEPLLADIFWQIVNEPNARHIDLAVNSNGTLLTERNVDRLLNSELKLINISLDAATAQTYRKIRRGIFDKVIAGIKRLIARRNELGVTRLQVWVNMTLMLENIRELPSFINLACDLEVDGADVWHLNMTGDMGPLDDWQITHNNWTFNYKEQSLYNAPALSNEMLRRAQAIAEERAFNFKPKPSHRGTPIWLPEESTDR
jgi:MoaA/NifB/PqqE/SkfB family radical SAM enzyme